MMRRVAEGTVRVPGSKSVTHRAYVLAAQSDRPCTVVRPLRSADTDATLACLHSLGARFRLDEAAVRFLPADLVPSRAALDCRNAGTTLRLLTAVAARLPAPVRFTGDASLQTRPNAALHEALRHLGASVDGDGMAPFTVQGPITPGAVHLPPATSSQFGSALLLALPMLAGPSVVEMDAPVASSPYLDVSLAVADTFQLRIEDVPAAGRRFEIHGHDVPHAPTFAVEGDWSTAAFPLAAAAVTGGRVTVRGLDPHSAQGDRKITGLLADFGCHVLVEDTGVTVEGAQLETPGTVDVGRTPDLFPVLCAVAAVAKGVTTFVGGAALRHKESDRIESMAAGLEQVGIQVERRPDGLVVHGGVPRGGRIHAHDDHRIHMAFRVLALAADGDLQVDGAASATVSYPGFAADLQTLTGGAT